VTQPKRLRSHGIQWRNAEVRHSSIRKPVIHAKHVTSEFEGANILANCRYHSGELVTKHRPCALFAGPAMSGRIPGQLRRHHSSRIRRESGAPPSQVAVESHFRSTPESGRIQPKRRSSWLTSRPLGGCAGRASRHAPAGSRAGIGSSHRMREALLRRLLQQGWLWQNSCSNYGGFVFPCKHDIEVFRVTS
jgi:hypothetical protein